MKRLLLILLVGIMSISLCACESDNNETAEIETNKDIETEESPVFNPTSLHDAMKQYVLFVNSAKTEEEKQEYERLTKDYLIENLSGYYYYKEPDTGWSNSVKDDDRAIYVKSRDEIYIAPYTEKFLLEKQMTLEDLADIKDSELYKYRLLDITFEEYSEYVISQITLESVYVDGSGFDDEWDFNTIEIRISSQMTESDSYLIRGYFADQTNKIGEYQSENVIDIHGARNYYASEQVAKDVKETREDEANNRPPKASSSEKSEPAIGMTKDEVLNSSWGAPDKKNIDEYEWGTEEQWVYGKNGYIYFEDGIVTSISHR